MSSTAAPLKARKSGARVLVVEDDPATADALLLLLRHHGFEVLLAASVREAMDHLPARPDHILLDLMLPDGDGVRILEEARRSGLDARIVVITGAADPEQLVRVRSLKPEALLKKPVKFAQILEKLLTVA